MAYIDETGRIAIPTKFAWAGEFNESLALVCQRDKVGTLAFVDSGGVVKFPLDGRWSSGFHEGLACAGKGEGRAGLINTHGVWVIEPRYTWVDDIHEGLIAVCRGKLCGFVDRAGRTVIPLRYEIAYGFSQGLAAVKSKGKWGFIGRSGEWVISPRYRYAYPFCEGVAAVASGKLWGFIDRRGHIVIPFRFEDAWGFKNGLASIKMHGRYGFIDREGRIVIPARFDAGAGFSEGLAAVKVGRRWGFVGTRGDMVIPARFQKAESFHGGLALAMDRDWGTAYVNRAGRVVWSPWHVFAPACLGRLALLVLLALVPWLIVLALDWGAMRRDKTNARRALVVVKLALFGWIPLWMVLWVLAYGKQWGPQSPASMWWSALEAIAFMWPELATRIVALDRALPPDLLFKAFEYTVTWAQILFGVVGATAVLFRQARRIYRLPVGPWRGVWGLICWSVAVLGAEMIVAGGVIIVLESWYPGLSDGLRIAGGVVLMVALWITLMVRFERLMYWAVPSADTRLNRSLKGVYRSFKVRIAETWQMELPLSNGVMVAAIPFVGRKVILSPILLSMFSRKEIVALVAGKIAGVSPRLGWFRRWRMEETDLLAVRKLGSSDAYIRALRKMSNITRFWNPRGLDAQPGWFTRRRIARLRKRLAAT